MAVGETERDAVDRPCPLDHAIDARRNRADELTAGRALGPDRPVRSVGPDLERRPALVVAVVPLDEVGIDPDAVGEPGKSRRVQRPRERARDDRGECMAGQPRCQVERLLAADRGERDVGQAGVATRTCPFGLAMPDQPNRGTGRRRGLGGRWHRASLDEAQDGGPIRAHPAGLGRDFAQSRLACDDGPVPAGQSGGRQWSIRPLRAGLKASVH